LRMFFLAAALALTAAAPAEAAVRIRASAGGVIGQYLLMFAALKQAGESVIIDGPCLSACTLVLSVMPRGRVCVTPRAVLGFHAAWTPGKRGTMLTHAKATRLMLDTYPEPVQAWIRRHGGLSQRTLLLRGRELAAMYPGCA
jgi:hypothetical protein